MVYKKNFVVAVKTGGKILREQGEVVQIPFGSEYSILLKNLESVRTQAKITIDGRDVGGWFVIQPNSSISIERFVKDHTQGNRFKFIERTEKVEEGRGIKADDGLIRVEYKKEKVWTPLYNHYYYWPYYNNWPIIQPSYVYTTCGTLQGQSSGLQIQSGSLIGGVTRGSSTTVSCNNLNVQTAANVNLSKSDAGITVEGSLSNQQFHSVSDFACEASEVITLQLRGRSGKAKVQKAVTVDVKPTCVTCKKKNKANAKFCIQCGTSLQIV